MQNIKKLSFEEIQTIVNDLLSGRSQVVQIEILVRLILICIKAILYENQSFMPGIVSHVENPFYMGRLHGLKMNLQNTSFKKLFPEVSYCCYLWQDDSFVIRRARNSLQKWSYHRDHG